MSNEKLENFINGECVESGVEEFLESDYEMIRGFTNGVIKRSSIILWPIETLY